MSTSAWERCEIRTMRDREALAASNLAPVTPHSNEVDWKSYRTECSHSCIGYLAHPFKKWPLGLSPPASFSWSDGTQPSKWRGNGSHRPEKPNVFGQQSIREGMQRLHERSAIDLYRHDAMSWIDLVHQLDTRTYGLALGCPTVVMVQPSHDWKNDHLFACMMRGKR